MKLILAYKSNLDYNINNRALSMIAANHTPFTPQERDHIFNCPPISLSIASQSKILQRSSSMYRNDYESMLPMRWLRSQAINVLLKILHCNWADSQEITANTTKINPAEYVKIMDSFLVTMIMTTEDEDILSSLAGLELFGEQTRYLIIPINTENNQGCHWQVLLYQNGRFNAKQTESKLVIFDSINGAQSAADAFLSKIQLLHKIFNLPQPQISLTHAMNLPMQANNYDCGIFVVGYCEYILRQTRRQLKGGSISIKWSSMKEIGNDILDQQGMCREKYRSMVEELIRQQIQ